ncbi:peptidoglycan DD-metalloendopeptidase family protein [Jatrophihabitans sp.]|uniref:peptidoglycan DD-metalloendopeptidase family protein n=1 Tax=Jatrophihabitans sp. TaxID=1932789 RepID=UPI0030C71623|nr:Membrane-bound metallopeptidase [Jatrophihabitans sp.]
MKRPVRTLLVVVAAAALAAVGLSAPAGAATSSSHPYSDPVWFPVHVATRVGCIGPGSAPNPGGGKTCAADHAGYFGMNINVVPSGSTYPTAGIYAAGAGLVIGVVSNLACTAGTTSAGNYVAVSHGAGVVTMYEHLRSIPVKTGQLVTAGQLLGYASNTGSSCSAKPYTDFVIRVDGGGYQDKTKAITTLKACVGGKTQSWPSAIKSSYTSWIKVPYLTAIPTSATGCGQTTAPVTYSKPGVKASSTSAGHVTVSWSSTHATGTEIQEMIFRPSTGKYDVPCSGNISSCSVGYTNVPTTTTVVSKTLTGLISKRKYEFRITRRNAVGWSLWSSWVVVTVK